MKHKWGASWKKYRSVFFVVIGVIVIGVFKMDPSLNVSCNYYSPLGGLRAGP